MVKSQVWLLIAAVVIAGFFVIGRGGTEDDPAGKSRDRSSSRRDSRKGGGGGSSGGGSFGGGGALRERSGEARLRYQLAGLNCEHPRSIARLLEEYGVGPRTRSTQQVIEFVEMAIRAIEEDDRAKVRRGALAALGHISTRNLPAGIDPFTPAFADEDPQVRRQALLAYGRHGAGKDWSRVAARSVDPEWLVRAAAAIALGAFPIPEVVPTLVGLLSDEHSRVIDAAADSLGKTLRGPPPKELLAAARSSGPFTRAAAAKVLSSLGGTEAGAVLIRLIDDPNWQVRWQAMRGAIRLNGDQARIVTGLLVKIGTDPTKVRTDRFEALQRLARARSDPDLSALRTVAERDLDPVLRLVAARTLLSFKDPTGLAPLVSLLSVRYGPHADEEDVDFVKMTAAKTLRAVCHVNPKNDDETTWRRLLPHVQEQFAKLDRVYSPRHIVEFW